MAHSSELDVAEGNWSEDQFNYRLNHCDSKFYLVDNNQVVAHLGIYEDTVKSVFVDEDYRGQEVALLLYEYVFKIYPLLYSDDARENGGTRIWEKLKDRYPSKIKYLKNKDQYVYTAEELD